MKRQKLAVVLLIPVLFILTQNNSSVKSAIIVDSINQEGFKTKSIDLLSSNDYSVEYYSGEEVSVEFLKNIPTGYDLYIFRVHSTCINNRTWVFSGEKYQAKSYPILQIAELVHKAKPSQESGYLFAVSPEFIQEYNKDGFKDGIVLMMGCQGLCVNDLADAFCEEGASIYVSWDGNVCLKHTDRAFLSIIESICARKSTILEALDYAQNQIGCDPVYHSSLNYLTLEHDSHKVS